MMRESADHDTPIRVGVFSSLPDAERAVGARLAEAARLLAETGAEPHALPEA